uniref:NADH-ubiquinone oxidoreductase chain 6 n=1 Tax=Rhyacotriton variegatus TaxID=291264 RepID=Q644W0_9SALA|nr:NADH dehydrogenase subunit 6 [Rhyacotriton variegatus]AAU20524.1 NADH dehydrogenase subunit 6 [Rhyacotriton variegatus]
MMFMSFLSMLGLIIGLIAVASNPSPYYAAFGLILGVVCGCCMMVVVGVSFLSLILLLIYLGGMLVVFVYSASLASEPYPDTLGSWPVVIYVCFYCLLLTISYFLLGWRVGTGYFFSNYNVEFNVVVVDLGGVSVMYSFGMFFLMVSGWVLFLTLFVVLEVTRGVSYGSLRAV